MSGSAVGEAESSKTLFVAYCNGDSYVGQQVIECFGVGRHESERQEYVAPKGNAEI